jgi:hypothetical protein
MVLVAGVVGMVYFTRCTQSKDAAEPSSMPTPARGWAGRSNSGCGMLNSQKEIRNSKTCTPHYHGTCPQSERPVCMELQLQAKKGQDLREYTPPTKTSNQPPVRPPLPLLNDLYFPLLIICILNHYAPDPRHHGAAAHLCA